MNNSEQAHLQISRLQDGQLSSSEAAQTRRQLAQDPALQQAHCALADLQQLLQTAWPAPEHCPDVRHQVLARVQRDLAAARRSLWPTAWGRPAWSFAWACSGLLAGLFLWSSLIHQLDQQQADQTLGDEITLAMTLPMDETVNYETPGAMVMPEEEE